MSQVEVDSILKQLGERVRSLREKNGFSRRELAERSGLSLRFLAELEAGRANISVVNLLGVSRALGVASSDLLVDDVAPKKIPRVISLLGLRGAGKSTVGAALANRLRVPFFELDRLIESEAGMSLAEIFAIHGETYFRQVELSALRRFLSEHDAAVLATGGGLVTSPEAFELLSRKTRTIWLRAAAEEHWERVVGQGDTRPMRNRPHAMAELKRRLREREPLYAKAHVTCVTSRKTVASVVSELARQTANDRAQ